LLEWGADPTPIIKDIKISALGMLSMQIFKDATEEEILEAIRARQRKGLGAFKGYLKSL